MVDTACASACDEIIHQLQPLESVYVIGTHSKGALHFGNVGSLVLPHSKIIVNSGWSILKPQNDAPEGLGYSPDIYVYEDDGLEAAKKLLSILNPR